MKYRLVSKAQYDSVGRLLREWWEIEKLYRWWPFWCRICWRAGSAVEFHSLEAATQCLEKLRRGDPSDTTVTMEVSL